MKEELTKQEIQEKIKQTFLKNPSPSEIKKIKKLAMSKNVKLREFKKRFCKKCYSLFNSKNSEIRIKNSFKTIRCKNCNSLTRHKLI